jgi:four helix bundle protein
MRSDKDNLIVQLSFDFAKEIVLYTEKLESFKKYNLSNQLFKSGTSIGANIWEAQNAESKNDFIHKIKIAAKEQMKLNIGCCFVKKVIAIQIVLS